MAYEEYNDLFVKCQNTGKYHMFVFDIEGSKKMDTETRCEAGILMIKLVHSIYDELKNEEVKRNKKILVYEEGFYPPVKDNIHEFGFKVEPFYLGDMFGFTVYRDLITKEEVMNIYNKHKERLSIKFDFHFADGYYETNNWEEASEKYFRGYCIHLLSEFHKPKNNELKNQLNKNQKR